MLCLAPNAIPPEETRNRRSAAIGAATATCASADGGMAIDRWGRVVASRPRRAAAPTARAGGSKYGSKTCVQKNMKSRNEKAQYSCTQVNDVWH